MPRATRLFEAIRTAVRQVRRAPGFSAAVIFIVAVGIGTPSPTTRIIEGQLHDVSGADPLAYGAAALVLTRAAALACALPATRAARVDPMVGLRED